ncbi:hypothetical protein [Nonomuraea gerenzanensis]|uniref:hypothetical protein n=1 Tax=Nonomuraea gerenzanensis TaxID=93944 RepID=UPI001CD9270D|nr:hypothetical protein [Nonomuraea gerenzanensis]UBU13494.1 hypothetical protein LCN96_00185 [Nonomuraea gerenzanensis]
MTDRDLFTYALVAGTIALAIAILSTIFGDVARAPGFAISSALIGIGFMLAAVALAIFERRDKGNSGPGQRG